MIAGRRATLARIAALLAACPHPPVSATAATPSNGDRPLRFPFDFGAHPETRIEWWYVTGALDAGPRTSGFQITFFRAATGVRGAGSSRFAAHELVFAHAAVADLQARRLRHDQRIARSGFRIAEATVGTTDVVVRDWRLVRSPDTGEGASAVRGKAEGASAARGSGKSASVNRGASEDASSAPGAAEAASAARVEVESKDDDRHSRYIARAASDRAGFAFDLVIDATQPVLLQGERGVSRKGPAPEQTSRYYSEPQLAVRGSLALDGRRADVVGRAWLDHEWSDAFLDRNAVGWDWIGMNLDDGGALTAFRLRRADASALWTGGSFRPAGGAARDFAGGGVAFVPRRTWQSAASGARYPVEWQVTTPVGRFTVRALLDDQELDSRASTGAIYWEGLSVLLDEGGRRIGRGYLEMTGYAARLVL